MLSVYEISNEYSNQSYMLSKTAIKYFKCILMISKLHIQVDYNIKYSLRNSYSNYNF